MKIIKWSQLVLVTTLLGVMPMTVKLMAEGNEITPVDTGGLNSVGKDWLTENPFRKDKAQYEVAIKIGMSGYNQNCARCHGLEVITGGIAPDLRMLEEGKDGDEWFINRIRNGYAQNGLTKMPKFEGIFTQEAMWAIRSYIETRPKPE
jgi:cytochrome c-550 PedF